MPEQGSYKPKERGLREAIDARFPVAATWRDHGLFAVIDPVMLTEREVHKIIYALPEQVSGLVIGKLHGSVTRYYRRPQLEVQSLVECGSIDALAALIGLFREAELRDDKDLHSLSTEGIMQLLPSIDSHEVLGHFAHDLRTFIGNALPVIWRFRRGVYHDGLV